MNVSTNDWQPEARRAEGADERWAARIVGRDGYVDKLDGKRCGSKLYVERYRTHARSIACTDTGRYPAARVNAPRRDRIVHLWRARLGLSSCIPRSMAMREFWHDGRDELMYSW